MREFFPELPTSSGLDGESCIMERMVNVMKYTDNFREFKVFLKGTGIMVRHAFSWAEVENFLREQDAENRYAHGWKCELDAYDIVCIR